MSDLGNYLKAISCGALSTTNGYFALASLLDIANTKAVVLQTQLANAPEITEQVYNTAKEVAEDLSGGDWGSGLFSAAIAGLTGGISIYYACRKED